MTPPFKVVWNTFGKISEESFFSLDQAIECAVYAVDFNERRPLEIHVGGALLWSEKDKSIFDLGREFGIKGDV